MAPRLAATLVDTAIIVVIALVVMALLVEWVQAATADLNWDGEETSVPGRALAIFFAIGVVLALPLPAVMNATGGSLGKRVFGLRLEKAGTGENIGFVSAVLRGVVSLASVVAITVGYLWGWERWEVNHETWHDRVAGSIVVRARRKKSRLMAERTCTKDARLFTVC